MAIVENLGLAAAAGLVVFFVMLGLLVIFIEDLEMKLVLGLLFILLGVTIALLAAGEVGIGIIVLAAVGAIVMHQVLQHFTSV